MEWQVLPENRIYYIKYKLKKEQRDELLRVFQLKPAMPEDIAGERK